MDICEYCGKFKNTCNCHYARAERAIRQWPTWKKDLAGMTGETEWKPKDPALPRTQQGRLFRIYMKLEAQTSIIVQRRPKGKRGILIADDDDAKLYQKHIEPKQHIIAKYFLK